METRLIALGILAVVAFEALLVAPSFGNDFMIIPADRIGDISLKIPIEVLQRMLGTPSSTQRRGYGWEATVTYNWRNHMITVNYQVDRARITGIGTYWTGVPNPYKTEKGLALGATSQDVMQAHGKAGCLVQDYSTSRELYWPLEGIAFYIAHETGRVVEIRVRWKAGLGAWWYVPAGYRICQ